MKISIVTPFDSANYGAFLQAYCLKKQLESWGHTVNHVLTRDEKYVQGLYYQDRPRGKKDKILFWRFMAKKEYGMEKYRLFREYQKMFHVTDDPAADDLCILGSDEIWNINQPAFRRGIFWGIGMPKVISYAVSIGSASFEDLEKYPEMINAVRKINVALVRDQRTKEFIQRVDPRKPVDIVCDPTMLVPVDTCGYECNDPYLKENACLLIYAYNLRKEVIDAIKRYAHEKGMKTVACCFYHSWCDHQCIGGPLQFSSMIRQCRGVITTTFHGSIFSILNHADFVSIPTSPKTNQLLEQFGLIGRLLDRDKISEQRIAEIMEQQIDYDEVDKKVVELRTNSLEKLAKAIESSKFLTPFEYQICPSDDCTGCFACKNKCPKQAIHVTTDKYGRTLPMIDPALCVHCGLCKAVCPVMNPVTPKKSMKCYAAQLPDVAERKRSASGGIGAALAEATIKNGGVVYGAAVTKDAVVAHQRADTLEGVDAFRRSKYVQSDVSDSYAQVLKDLRDGREVLFTGTPCQIVGLHSFLGQEYPNLCTVDIICHGVPPMKYLTDYIGSIVPDKKVDSFSFRGGDRDFVFKLFSENEIVYEKYGDADSYFRAFRIDCLIYRENCYHCRYATPDRVGDLTIGDFWNLNRGALTTPQTGKISAILVNSKKGEEAFNAIRSRIIFEEREMDEAVQGNAQLRKPSQRPADRDAFLDSYLKTGDYLSAIRSTSVPEKIKAYLRSKTLLYRGIRKVKHMMKLS